jgi:hypothetical protein
VRDLLDGVRPEIIVQSVDSQETKGYQGGEKDDRFEDLVAHGVPSCTAAQRLNYWA